ncbi:hypothetical protein Aperf_G00000067352 [Anoplocephala perfoliata]
MFAATCERLRERWALNIPGGVWGEWKALSNLAIPIMLTSLVEYLTAPISLYFCGMLGKTELAAAGLAISLFHTAGLSFIMGFLTAGETLFAQTYGGINKFRLGIQVQRSFLIATLLCLPCWAVYLIIEPILLATNQPPLIAKYTSMYILGLIPGLFFFALFEILTKYVQTQNRVLPPMIAGILGNIVNAICHFIFIYHSDMKFVGSAISQSISFLCQAGFILLYILTTKIYKNTWDGLHVEMWHDWGVWFRLGIPGVVMVGLEWWICEAGSLTAGLRGEEALAVQTILNNIESVIYSMFPMGYGIAVAIQIGRFVGANDAIHPKVTAFVGIMFLAFVAIVNSLILLLCRYYIPKIFTTDERLIEGTAYSMPFMVAYTSFDSIVGVCSGIIRGVGMQKTGAIVCCVCLYLVGGPFALYLLLCTDLVVSGFWLGLAVGVLLEMLTYIILCCRIDWEKMCRIAQKRTVIKFVRSSGERKRGLTTGDENETSLTEAEEKLDSEDCELNQVKACTPVIVITRSAMILSMIGLLLISLCCRYGFDWSTYFPNHCLLTNGTLIPLTSRNETKLYNCTLLIP